MACPLAAPHTNCPICGGAGKWELTTLKGWYDNSIAELQMVVADLDMGLGWPDAGGWLNQSNSCVEAVRMYRRIRGT